LFPAAAGAGDTSAAPSSQLLPAAASESASRGSNGGEMYEDDGESTAAKAEAPGSGSHSAVTSVNWEGGCAAGAAPSVSSTCQVLTKTGSGQTQ